MARFDYDRSRASAERMIDRFGQAGAIRRRTGGSGGDPWNPGSQTGGTSKDWPCKFVLLDYTARERAGTQIGATDRRAYVSTEGLEVDPLPGDDLVSGDVVLPIQTVAPLAPGGTTLLYDLRVTS